MGEVIIKLKEVDGGLDGAPAWIATFVDMISLLVTFFILLYTFASMKEFQSFSVPIDIMGTTGVVSDKLGDTIDAPSDDIMAAMDLQRGATNPHSRPADQLPDNMEEMGQKLTDEHVEFDANHVRDGMRMRFDPRAAFAPGSAIPNDVLRIALRECGAVLQHYQHLIVVEGFTDNAFIPSQLYPTAEDLSLARAEAAAKVILAESNVSSKTLMLAGLGNTPLPLNTNSTAVQRRFNRRVEIRILAMSESHARQIEGGAQ